MMWMTRGGFVMGWWNGKGEASPMTEVERRLRDECEAKVHKGLQATAAVLEAGKALKTLKDGELWRDTHDDWTTYCRERFKLTTRRALQLIEFAGMVAVYEGVTGTDSSGEPPSEWSMRPLSGLEPEAMAEALTEAVEESGGQTPTAKAIQKAAKKRKPKAKRKAKPPKARTVRVAGAKVVIQPTHAEPTFRGWEVTLQAALNKLKAQSEPVVPVSDAPAEREAA
jgi:hypothetical protein